MSNKTCFSHHTTYADSKGLNKKVFADKKIERQNLWSCYEFCVWWISDRINKYGL